MMAVVVFVREVALYLAFVTLLVIAHDLGHLLAARLLRVRVGVVSLGIGPPLFERIDRTGTAWRLGRIPIGGFLRMAFKGDFVLGVGETPRKTFSEHSLATRAIVVLAGPVFSLLFGILILYVHAAAFEVRRTPAVITNLTAGGAAERSGFQLGDRITQIDGRDILNYWEVGQLVSVSQARQLSVTVLRDNKPVALKVTPQITTSVDDFGREFARHVIGVAFDPNPIKELNSSSAALQSVGTELAALWAREISIFESKPDEVGGPILMQELTDKLTIRHTSMEEFTRALGLCSVIFAALTFLPITPISDGIHLGLIGFQFVTGKELSDRTEDRFARAWLSLLVLIGLAISAVQLWALVA